jgi:hypothetical protein
MAYTFPVKHKILPRTHHQIERLMRRWGLTYSFTVERILADDHKIGPDTEEMRALLCASRIARRTVIVEDVRMSNHTYQVWSVLHRLYGYHWYVQSLEHMVVRAYLAAGLGSYVNWTNLSQFDQDRVRRARNQYHPAPSGVAVRNGVAAIVPCSEP